jgi:hypothetical protein
MIVSLANDLAVILKFARNLSGPVQHTPNLLLNACFPTVLICFSKKFWVRLRIGLPGEWAQETRCESDLHYGLYSVWIVRFGASNLRRLVAPVRHRSLAIIEGVKIYIASFFPGDIQAE